LSLTHVIAATCALFVCSASALLTRRPRPMKVAAAILFAMVLVQACLWAFLDENRNTQGPMQWVDSHGPGIEFLNPLLGIVWSDPLRALSLVAWTVLGPFRGAGQLFVCVVIVATANLSRTREHASPVLVGRVATVAALFGVISWLAPWGFEKPEVKGLNLRMMGLAFGLAIALVPPRRFATLRGQLALAVGCLLVVCHFGYRTFHFARQADATLAVVARAAPSGVMAGMPFHKGDASFADEFRVEFYLPLYYTVLRGGISTQFWGQYTGRFPVAYRAGKEFRNAFVWNAVVPTVNDFDRIQHVLFGRATERETEREHFQSREVERTVSMIGDLTSCAGDWCLYRLDPTQPGVIRSH
jgi:hypothetical protein